jgi:hypothetical protein
MALLFKPENKYTLKAAVHTHTVRVSKCISFTPTDSEFLVIVIQRWTPAGSS